MALKWILGYQFFYLTEAAFHVIKKL